MKQKLSIILALLLLTACGQPAGGQASSDPSALSWQEQYDLGVRYLSAGNYQEAIIAFTAAIEIDPKRVDAYLGLADVYIQQEDYDEALAVLQKGLEKIGENQEITDKISEIEALQNMVSIQYPRLYATATSVTVIPDTDQILRGINDAVIVEVEYSFDTSSIPNDLSNRIHKATCILGYTFNYDIDQVSGELEDDIKNAIDNFQEEHSKRYSFDGEKYYPGERQYPSGKINLHTFSTNPTDKIWVLLALDVDGNVLGYSLLPLSGYSSSDEKTWESIS